MRVNSRTKWLTRSSLHHPTKEKVFGEHKYLACPGPGPADELGAWTGLGSFYLSRAVTAGAAGWGLGVQLWGHRPISSHLSPQGAEVAAHPAAERPRPRPGKGLPKLTALTLAAAPTLPMLLLQPGVGLSSPRAEQITVSVHR